MAVPAPEIDPVQAAINAMQVARDEAALRILEANAFKVAKDLERGEFKLQVHRTNADAPLSPVYLNLRPEGVKEGTLDEDDFDNIGRAMALFANHLGLLDEPRYVAGIPSAGIPFVSNMHSWLDTTYDNLLGLYLQKIGEGDDAHIAPPGVDDRPLSGEVQNVLLVDDLVTKAGTKKQAIEAVAAMGGKVTDLLIFVDRSGGRAKAEMASLGVQLHALWEFDALLEFWHGKGLLGSRDDFDKLMAAVDTYPAKLAPFIAS